MDFLRFSFLAGVPDVDFRLALDFLELVGTIEEEPLVVGPADASATSSDCFGSSVGAGSEAKVKSNQGN